jgi:signal transduction histidine kinase
VATSGGLTHLKDGRMMTLGHKNGLPCDSLDWVIQDDAGSFWLNMECGLVRVTRTEIDAWLRDPGRMVEFTVLDDSDGVRSHPFYGNASPHVAKGDGKLWFSTWDGLSVVDPQHLPANKLPPVVHVEQVIADGKTYWRNPTGDRSSELPLPPRVRDLEIDYTALSFVAPERNRFKYRLEGYDREWRESGNRRQAYYGNLPPRNYRFRVIASNNSGLWNEQGDTLAFSIAPAYYQSNWFRALCVTSLVGLLWLTHRWRVGQLERDFNLRVEARVNERSRIARDLHDTLLQGVQASLIQMQVARTLASRKLEQALEPLDQAIGMTEAAIAEGRDAIRELRSGCPVPTNLAKWLTLIGQELASAQNPDGKPPARFRVTVEGEERNMKPPIQDEAYRIGRELLRNAFQHAHATEIEAAVRYDGRLFRLRVRDDGTGIDQKVVKAGGRSGHWGLTGMRERAKQIGGQLEIWSQNGVGTEVELSIPGSLAYEQNRENRRLFALFAGKSAILSSGKAHPIRILSADDHAILRQG